MPWAGCCEFGNSVVIVSILIDELGTFDLACCGQEPDPAQHRILVRMTDRVGQRPDQLMIWLSPRANQPVRTSVGLLDRAWLDLRIVERRGD